MRSRLTGALLGVLAGAMYMVCCVLFAVITALVEHGWAFDGFTSAEFRLLAESALYVLPPWTVVGAVDGAATGALAHLLRRQRGPAPVLVPVGITLGTVAPVVLLMWSC